jgi:hypothetical protein
VTVAELVGVRDGVNVGDELGVVVELLVGVVVTVGVGDSAGTIGTAVTSETTLGTSVSNAAVTCNSICPRAGSVTLKRSVNVPSPATASPFVPSSSMVPSEVGIGVPFRRNRATLDAISAGSPGAVVIVLEAVIKVATPT